MSLFRRTGRNMHLVTKHVFSKRSSVVRCVIGCMNGSTLGLAIAREPGRIGWVTGRTYTMGATTVYSWQASHDALGRPVATADSESAARIWTYNERSEMTGCTSSDGSHSYFYDSIGNRTSSSSTGGGLSPVTHSYTANGLNQYDYVDSTALTYDADGNLTGDGRYSYAYDCENRLVSVTPVSPSSGDLAIVNEYDHMNRRVRKTVRRHVGSAWQLERPGTAFLRVGRMEHRP